MDIMAKITAPLPPVKHIMPTGEPDFYGFSHLIAEKLGFKKVPFSYGGWKHGWPFLPIAKKELYISNYSKNKFFVVPTEKQRLFLNTQGIFNVKAGGLPFVYSDELKDIKRVHRSLLVMPGHITRHTTGQLSYSEHKYIEYIKSHKEYFDDIIFCLNQNCIRQGLWIKSLKQAGISYVVGAESYDINSFKRLRTIMQHFEYMTTNQIGSHVLYASLCGCKVSIANEFVCYIGEKVCNATVKVEKLYEENMTSELVRKNYPQFCIAPHKAQLNIEWARAEAGVDNMLEPEEIAELFRWNDKAVQFHGIFCGGLMRCKREEVFKRMFFHIMRIITKIFVKKKKFTSPGEKYPE